MADEADRADVQTQVMLDASLANAKSDLVGKAGPEDCTSCGEWNDRSRKGYATCSDCFAELLGA